MSDYRYWTMHEVRDLRALYPTTGNKELGARFARNPKAVALMARKLGLKKSPEYMATHCRYQQGLTPWNKGKTWNPPGSRATRFQAGRRGARQKPVGHERMERDGLMVKVSEPNVWTSKARLVWARCFGPIPAGMLVRLKDGDKANCSPENLMLVSRQENARLNVIKRRPQHRPNSWAQLLVVASVMEASA